MLSRDDRVDFLESGMSSAPLILSHHESSGNALFLAKWTKEMTSDKSEMRKWLGTLVAVARVDVIHFLHSFLHRVGVRAFDFFRTAEKECRKVNDVILRDITARA